MKPEAGYEEIAHTADWSLHVWAPTLEELFRQAALGMQSLMGVAPGRGPREERRLRAQALDSESLLVWFLSEMLYLIEDESLAFDQIGISLQDGLEARLVGSRCDPPQKIIKAVTYHNLNIRRTERGYEAELVFDV